ncbi:hypothetical protein WME88_27475 [Sorangium sp. So ce216]
MSWITDKLLGLRAVFFGGSQLPERGAVEFAGAGVSVEDDPSNRRTKVTIAGGGEAIGEVNPTAGTIVQRGPSGEVMASYVRAEWVVRLPRSADESAAASVAEVPLTEAPGFLWTVTSIKFYPASYVLEDEVAYAELFINVRNISTGDAVGSYAQASTVEGWLAFGQVDIPLVPGANALPIGPTDILTVSVVKGAPVMLPAGLWVIVCKPWPGA